jgi:phosphoglycolate phosphatase-like HAD superfamily hydrolase
VPTVFVFDIDLTLVHSRGAGLRAMERTFVDLYGVPAAFAGIEFAGRTDGAILRECFLRQALDHLDIALEIERFREIYFGHLGTALASEDLCEVLPGVQHLLDALDARSDVVLGLGTGNFRPAAEIKLRHVDLWHRFRDGGFADDSDDRTEVIAAAIRRLTAYSGPDARVWVVGDSYHDVAAAKANGVPMVGVATGHCSTSELAAFGADVALQDLADVQAFIAHTLAD